MMIKVICTLLQLSDPTNKMISTFLSTGHSVHICINSRWQTKNKMARLLLKFLKRAHEKQRESLFQPCAITVYE